jgi:hypothetical protein
MRRLKSYGQKKLKPALRASGQLEDRTLRYRQSLDGAGSYRYDYGERAPKRQKSLRDEAQTNCEVEETVSRTESVLDDITERARNRLIGMALEGLFAAGEVSLMAETAAALAPAGKNRRVTWEANIYSEKETARATVGDDFNAAAIAVENRTRSEAPTAVLHHETDTHMLKEEPLANDKEASVPTLEPATVPSEDLTPVEVDEVVQVDQVDTSTLPNTELPIDTRFSDRGERNVDVAVRASVPYPASLFLATAMDVETENTAVNYLSEGFATAMDVEIENSAVSYVSGGFDTDMMETEASTNDTGTGGRGIESIQDLQMDEAVSRAFHTVHCWRVR